ncbi:hypothetical protein ABGV43_30095 [Paenibacillus amylolyticus]|uniref:DUF6941 family protein n=1 Tax=Paenibacillus amylolyticus TaxID=1451 RepID=UPI003242A1F3
MKSTPIVRTIMVVEDVDFVPTQTDSKMILTQPTLNFNVPFIPTQLSFSIVVSISDFDREASYNVELKLKDTDGVYLNSLSWEIKDMSEASEVPTGGIIVAGIKNLPIHKEGKHDIELFIGDEKIGEGFFTVFKIRG